MSFIIIFIRTVSLPQAQFRPYSQARFILTQESPFHGEWTGSLARECTS